MCSQSKKGRLINEWPFLRCVVSDWIYSLVTLTTYLVCCASTYLLKKELEWVVNAVERYSSKPSNKHMKHYNPNEN